MESMDPEVMLHCILSRITSLICFCSSDIQEDLENAKFNIMSVLRKLGFNVSPENVNLFEKINSIDLYNELVSIEQSLTSVSEKLPNYSSLEEAIYDISLAIKGLISEDSSVKEHHNRVLALKKLNNN